MKKYVKPTIEIENFVANEYVAACAVQYTCQKPELDYSTMYMYIKDGFLEEIDSKNKNFRKIYTNIDKTSSAYYLAENNNVYLKYCNGCRMTSELSEVSNAIYSDTNNNDAIGNHTDAYAWYIKGAESFDADRDVYVNTLHHAQYKTSNAIS